MSSPFIFPGPDPSLLFLVSTSLPFSHNRILLPLFQRRRPLFLLLKNSVFTCFYSIFFILFFFFDERFLETFPEDKSLLLPLMDWPFGLLKSLLTITVSSVLLRFSCLPQNLQRGSLLHSCYVEKHRGPPLLPRFSSLPFFYICDFVHPVCSAPALFLFTANERFCPLPLSQTLSPFLPCFAHRIRFYRLRTLSCRDFIFWSISFFMNHPQIATRGPPSYGLFPHFFPSLPFLPANSLDRLLPFCAFDSLLDPPPVLRPFLLLGERLTFSPPDADSFPSLPCSSTLRRAPSFPAGTILPIALSAPPSNRRAFSPANFSSPLN